jgi:hypothetical protein
MHTRGRALDRAVVVAAEASQFVRERFVLHGKRRD